MRNPRKLMLSGAAILAAVVFASACSDPEAAARKLFNQGMTLQREGETEEAFINYQKVVELYPKTQTAVDANKLLLHAQSAMDFLNGKLLQQRKRTRELQRENILSTLDLYRLENGAYPTTEQGLEALIKKPEGLAHWKGPYMKEPEEFSKLIPYFEYRGPTGHGAPTLNIRRY